MDKRTRIEKTADVYCKEHLVTVIMHENTKENYGDSTQIWIHDGDGLILIGYNYKTKSFTVNKHGEENQKKSKLRLFCFRNMNHNYSPYQLYVWEKNKELAIYKARQKQEEYNKDKIPNYTINLLFEDFDVKEVDAKEEQFLIL